MSTYRLPAHCAAVYQVQSLRKHVGRRTKGRQRFATIDCVFYTAPLYAVSSSQRAIIVARIGIRTLERVGGYAVTTMTIAEHGVARASQSHFVYRSFRQGSN